MSLSRTFARGLTVTLLGTVALLLPAQAGAATYCVGDPGCVAGGGTDRADLAAAFASATGGGADTIRIGAGTFETTTYLESGADDPLTVVGAGTGTTVVHLADGAGPQGISLADELSSISQLDIDSDLISANTALSLFSAVADTGPQAHDLRIYGDGLEGIAVRGHVLVERVDVRVRRDDPAFTSSTPTAISHQPGSVAGSIARVRDSHLEGAFGVRSYADSADATVEVQRTSIEYSWKGVDASANTKELDVRLADDLFTYEASPDYTVGTAGVEVSSGGGPGTSSDIDGFVWDSTFVSSAPSAFALRSLANGGSTLASTTLYANGVMLVGSFNNHASAYDGDAGAAAAQNYTQITTSRTTAVPTYPAAGGVAAFVNRADVSQVVDPGFVDAAGGDYRPRWGSALLDVGHDGTNVQVPWVAPFDLLGEPRPVWSTASTAPSPKTDIGAYEYNRRAPVATAGSATLSVAPGAAVALTGSATDANPGEASTLTYAWSLPGGATSALTNPSITAPTAPGSYPVSLVATDVAGAASAPSTLTLVVVAPPVVAPPAATPPIAVPPVTQPPALVDRTAPKVTFSRVATSLPKLLLRTPLVSKFTLGERATTTSSLVATVTLPPLRRGLPVRRIPVVLAANRAVLLQPGARQVKLTPTRAGLARLAALRAKAGARVVGYAVQLTVVDAARNRATPSVRVAVAPR